MAQKSKEILQVETIHVAADKGYDNKDELEQSLLMGLSRMWALKMIRANV